VANLVSSGRAKCELTEHSDCNVHRGIDTKSLHDQSQSPICPGVVQVRQSGRCQVAADAGEIRLQVAVVAPIGQQKTGGTARATDVRRVAQKYLTVSNRTVLLVTPPQEAKP